MAVTVEGVLDGIGVRIRISRLILGAFTGRDEESTLAHIQELKSHGVHAPDVVPDFISVPPNLLTMSASITVSARESNGEVEVVLIGREGEMLVGVGSDHTDRDLEKADIRLGKLACPKVVSRHFWRFDALRSHWDSLVLRSWVEESGILTAYQEARVHQIMHPDELTRQMLDAVGGEMNETALFCGTIPTLRANLMLSPFLRGQLDDPILDRSLVFEYSTDTLE